MKILITGARGYLASALAPMLTVNYEVELTSRNGNLELHGIPIHSLSLENEDQTRTFLEHHQPDLIVNTAAISLPDWAEVHREETIAANITAVKHLVNYCESHDVPLLHISTDYVFSGENPPYDEEDPRAPVNFYGETKVQAENIIEQSDADWLICRTTALYGLKEPCHRPNPFTSWYAKLKAGEPVNAPTEHITNPTYVEDLALALNTLIERGARGIYHVAGKEPLSRYDFARTVAEVFGFDSVLVNPIALEEKVARRPRNTSLSVAKLARDFGMILRNAREALEDIRAKLEVA